jgi:hypothetical protein
VAPLAHLQARGRLLLLPPLLMLFLQLQRTYPTLQPAAELERP